MKLSEYIKELENLVKGNPQALDMEVIYAKDDEGNGYQYVGALPVNISLFRRVATA